MKPRINSLVNGRDKAEYALEMGKTPMNADVSHVTRKWLDIRYFEGENAQRCMLDVYLPEEGEGPFPVVVYIHGGGWVNGTRRFENLPPYISCLKRGFAFASFTYTLAQEADFPVQSYDLKAAVRFLRAHASEYTIDPDRIGIIGDSAGGHLVALLGTSGDVEALEDRGMGNSEYSSAVQAVIDLYGPINFEEYIADMEISEVPCGIRPQEPGCCVNLLLGGTMEVWGGKAAAASPETYITENCPPFLIQHGTRDDLVPVNQSIRFADKLKAKGVDVTLEIFKGAGHGTPEFFTQENTDRWWDFMEAHLKG